MYEYLVSVVEVHDGDTFTLLADLGFDTWHKGPFRLARCNARELAQVGGAAARDNLRALLPAGLVVTATTVKPDKYGQRYDAEIILPDGRNLTDWLAAQQWVAPWNGSGTKPVPPWPRTI